MISELAEQKVLLAEALSTHRPSIEDGEKLAIFVRNNIQEKEIIENQSLILDILKQKLNNDFITLKITVDPTKDEVRLVSNDDKIKRMVDLNPDLNLLRKMFDLEPE